ncbi:ADP-ribosylation factor-binding protein GGA3-like isoform X2 [Paramacrobiotus metropolitanus]|uniref:ADP-ribosylation factor-binding protein GGA3-like isoform X2 n=1 Tax=Paramacrobiotus metropolitanus TaxID=2943436 RepID=UPI0024464DA2|nr:ADP-ribosylation factor-binding protein GGA3-like isoform X2 [Paramacrobiotus metropolitanus]
MPMVEGENFVVKLTDPRALSHEQDVEDAFIKILQADLGVLAHCLKFLAHKVQSPCEREALKSIALLDTLARRGGRTVQSEIGKFRFLNELIKVVSPKYLGEKTAESVKKKTVELLYSWSQLMRYEQKIVEAYNMLKQQGIIKEDPVVFEAPPPPPPRVKNPIMEDEERAKLLRRLLQSKDPADMVAANRLIKSMVREDDQRVEKVVRRHSDLIQIKESADLLLDMMKHFSSGSSTLAERETMRQLFETCEQHRPRVFKLAAETAESNTETDDGPNLADILATSDELTEAIQQYRALGLSAETFDEKGKAQTSAPSTLPAELLSLDSASTSHVPSGPMPPPPKDDVLSILDEVFSMSSTSMPTPLVAVSPGSKLPTASSSSSLSGSNAGPDSATANSKADPTLVSPSSTRKTLVEFDDVTHSFLGGLSLSDKGSGGRGFQIETKPKRTLNEMQREPAAFDKQDIPAQRAAGSGDDELINDRQLSKKTGSPPTFPSQNGDVDVPAPIDGIAVAVNDLQLSAVPPVTAYDQNKLNVSIHVAKNKPRKDCYVLVATFANLNTSPISQLQFNVSGSKTMRVKVQSESAFDLPPYNPIFPSSPALQVIIVAKSERVRCARLTVRTALKTGEH